MGKHKIIGPDNKKLVTVVTFSGDAKKAVRAGNNLKAFVRNRKSTTGLAANQLGIMERVCIAKFNGTAYQLFFDPAILETEGHILSPNEGCLSFPENYGDVDRHKRILVSWVTYDNFEPTYHKEWFSDFAAIVLEHEIDHLNGIRCIDKMKEVKFKR